MRKNTGKWFISVAAIVLIAAAFYPHPTAAIPEWRIQVVDESGKPLAGIVVHQEWINLDPDGKTNADAKETDSAGWAILPPRRVSDSVALRIQDYFLARSKGQKSLLSTHAFVCWQDLTGDIFWNDLSTEPVHRLQLRKAGCGYG